MLPEAQDDLIWIEPDAPWDAPADDALPERPDLYLYEQQDEPPVFDPFLDDIETAPCPCCGAELPVDPAPGYICPVCWWEIDYFTEDEDAPSDQNHGLSLAEAQMNFRAFGISDPCLLHRAAGLAPD